ncbi:type I-E CRISPR-associated protein Cse1/CasA [Actinokineospora pegani]|uniref:type I-E CRISPR-associated protein Cse1/CasA n=1 Tax=Actinokineospora pegani TaxID=2654637 RepID=UPI0012EAD18D|nr:type I-E CRISPR-associated protein Cse1/CasA [Actinokineospora pegani]
MTSSETIFDLLEQPWILARAKGGATVELSLSEIFRESGNLLGLVGEVPTQVFATTRLLLAVLRRAMHRAERPLVDFEDWQPLWSAFPLVDVEEYLVEHRDRFDLLHPSTPFMQVADLRTAKGEMSDLSKLIADVPNNRPFFTTRIGTPLRLSLAEAARWVLHCQAFDFSGIKSGAADDKRVKGGRGYPIGLAWSGQLGGVLAEGRTLRETLLLNLIPDHVFGEFVSEDRPVWERAALTGEEEVVGGRTPTGPVDLYTWPSRRIRLAVDGDQVTGVLVCNGDKILPQNRFDFEPHTSWRRSTNQEKQLKSAVPVYMPLEHDPSRAIWRGLAAMLPAAVRTTGEVPSRRVPGVLRWVAELRLEGVLAPDAPVALHTIGMTYGSNNSVIDEVVEDRLSVPALLVAEDAVDLTRVVLSCVSSAESAAKALGSLAASLAEASGGEYGPARSRAVESAYDALDPLFRRWVRDDIREGVDEDDVQRIFHLAAKRAVARLGAELVEAAPATAWSGRKKDGRALSATHAYKRFDGELRAALPKADDPTPA